MTPDHDIDELRRLVERTATPEGALGVAVEMSARWNRMIRLAKAKDYEAMDAVIESIPIEELRLMMGGMVAALAEGADVHALGREL